jgi:hypothetical protein
LADLLREVYFVKSAFRVGTAEVIFFYKDLWLAEEHPQAIF